MDGVFVRSGTTADFARINEIYNFTIVGSHVSFDDQEWDLERRRVWWNSRTPQLDILVAELNDEVVGVAYSSWYRPKLAYRSSAETTIVLDPAFRRRGIGTVLLNALMTRLKEQGFHRAVAIVALPNDASIRLHERLGYRNVGTLTEAGYKLGRYWDTMILEAEL